ncbi:hypothetical protein IV203_002868 [Nitzschia inconspicua]|uniref:Uncharacterized protein n=1 Tax=Nitzschia inconspicua TaxID=303405 RepID=A0A9K3L0N3_9STRA|nr:hypothetical protein IV203_002868 [Nitzschia inconspicua]
MSSVKAESSNIILQPRSPQEETIIQQEREDNMPRGRTSLFVETRQSDHLENTASPQQGSDFMLYRPISPSASLSNLVINNDVITGSTEVLIKPTSTTPPTSPMGRNSLFPGSPLAATSPDGSSWSKSKSCQRRGRFLVWPVSAVNPTPPTTSRGENSIYTSPTATNSA